MESWESWESLTLGTNDPGNSPSGKTEALGETVNDEDIILVDILNVLGSRDGGTIAVARVVVAGVELIANKGGSITADVLDLGELGVGNDTAGRVARVGGQDDRSTSSNFLGDLVGVDVVAVALGERDGNGSKLCGFVSTLVAGGSYFPGKSHSSLNPRS
jgi:hypothetical protein